IGLGEARNVRVARLSGGQRQRLLVATALVARARLTVLDEPTTGLDPNARYDLWTAIRRRRDAGGAILLSTHSMEEAEALCDRVAILDRGRVVACGPPEELVHVHAPEQLVAFTADPAPERETLRTLPGVTSVDTRRAQGRTRVRLRTTEADRVLVALLTGGGPRIRAIETRDVGLEEVFRRLTGRAFETATFETGES
ncbi:MAG: AAA family ATPase, partial [Streptosporangiaceae bacterium]